MGKPLETDLCLTAIDFSVRQCESLVYPVRTIVFCGKLMRPITVLLNGIDFLCLSFRYKTIILTRSYQTVSLPSLFDTNPELRISFMDMIVNSWR